MKYSNEELREINLKKKKYNTLYSNYYIRLHSELKDIKYKKRSERLSNCLDIWIFDKYEKNYILDLKSVNRCGLYRVCPNCKLLNQRKYYYKIVGEIERIKEQGYKLQLLTLTIPNCSADNLSNELDRLNKNFRKLFHKFNQPTETGFNGYKDRLAKMHAALKSIEITYNHRKKTYHPHLHILTVWDSDLDETLLDKNIKGKYSFKKNQYNYHSILEMQVMKIWSLLDTGKRLTKKNLDSLPKLPDNKNDPEGQLRVIDLRDFDSNGLLELLKYTVKDNDIDNYEVFKTIIQSIENKRMKQLYGTLWGIEDSEEYEIGEYQELELSIEEYPQPLTITDIKELFTKYKNYQKISRFTPKSPDLLK